jgi:hypothetical protein
MDQSRRRQDADEDGINVAVLLELLEYVMGCMPGTFAATTARQLCKATHQQFKANTVVHLKGADLPVPALEWAFLNSLTTVKQRSQLLECRAAAGDMEQVEWLVMGWTVAVRTMKPEMEGLTG